MSGSRDGEQPSHSPRRANHDWYITDHLQHLSIQTQFSPTKCTSTLLHAMPCPEHNCYSNQQSAKVNAGLDFGGATSNIEEIIVTPIREAGINSNMPTLDIDFGKFDVPTQTAPPTPLTVQQYIRTLLDPPPHAFLHGVLSMQWVMGALGQSHFYFRGSDERYLLAPDSEVRTEGTRLGLRNVLMDWLCGDQEEDSPTEQGMLLTREFFQELKQERDGGAGK